MVPEQSTSSQGVVRDSNAVSMPSTPTTSRSPPLPPPTQLPPPTLLPPLQQQPVAPGTQQQQQPQMQGQFQPAYFQQYPRAYGQPIQPYNEATRLQAQQLQQYHQQYQQQQQKQEPTPAYVSNALLAWRYTKIAFHVVDICFCIAAIAISFAAGSRTSTGYIFALCTPIFFLALVWDLAEIITWLCRKRKASIHPGAHVGMSLIIWLGAAIIGSIQAVYVAYVVYEDDSCWDSDTRTYESCGNVYGSDGGLFIAVAILSFFVWLIHFILFVSACVETAKRNAARRQIVTVIAPPYWGPMTQGWQPMPQYYPQSRPATTAPQQSIPLQNTTPRQSMPPQAVPVQTRSLAVEEQQPSNKGKEPEQAYVSDKQGESSTQPARATITEYYTPTGTR